MRNSSVRRHGREYLEAFGGHFWADTIASHDSDLDQIRLRPFAVVSIADSPRFKRHHLRHDS